MYFLLYFFSYFLTLFGYLLGKSTTEEHNEIKKIVENMILISKLVFFGLMLYLFLNYVIIFIVFFGLFVVFFATKKIENKDLIKFYNLILLSISYIFVYTYKIDYLPLILILIFCLCLEKSFDKFNLKEEIYSIIFYSLIIVFLKFFL